MAVVHGLWARRRALCLWVDHPPAGAAGAPLQAAPRGPAADHPRAAPLGADAWEALAERAPLLAAAVGARSRGRLELALPTAPRGAVGSAAGPVGVAPWRVPVVALNPDRAVGVLQEVAALALGEGGDAAEGVGLADDLRWAAAVAAAAAGRVRAGRVAPALVAEDGAWWARWALLPDAPWRRWCAAAAAAAPASARAEVGGPAAGAGSGAAGGAPQGRPARELVGDLAGEVAAVLAARAVGGADLGPVGAGAGAGPVAAWARALLSGEPVDAPAAQVAALASRAERWRASAASPPAELLLRLVEPDDDVDDDADDDADGDAGGDAGGGPLAGGGWVLQARLRPVDDPSTALTAEEAERSGDPLAWEGTAGPWALLAGELARAASVHPPLEALGLSPERDAVLTAAQVLDLVEHAAPRLLEAGVALALPGRWLRAPVSLSLHARAAGGALDPAGPEATSPVARAAGDPARLAAADLVDVDWRVAVGGTELTEAELAAAVATRSPLVRLRGQWVQVDADRLARGLRFLRRSGHQRASLASVLGATASGALPVPVGAVTGEGALGDVLAGRAAEVLAPVPAPRGLAAQLRPYQERGLAWLAFMARLGLGVVLADDMGLGKTVQLLALLLHERERAGRAPLAPTLLVCPMSLVGNWQREAARFAPGLRVHVHHGPGRLRGEELAAAVAGADLVVTTYPLVARDTADLAGTAWGRVALDEAQHVKNPATRAARAVRAVAAAPTPPGGTHRVALTGTPVENRLAELHAVLDFADPGLLGSAASFRDAFAVPVERHRDEAAAARLAALTRPFVLRRTKTDPGVAPDLPAKLEVVVRATLTAEQAALYRAVVDDMLARVAAADGQQRRGLVLATLTRLKQVCNHPAQLLGDGSPLLRRGQHRSGKLALVDDVLDTVVAEGERALVFTQYRQLGELLAPHLSARYGAEVPFLHGGVARAGRDAMVERFSGDGGPPVMLVSLRAGGTGLNLVAANHVVHVDRWWNPAVEAQATDRAFRIGQTRQVQVRKLVCAGTVEERVDALMAAKADLAERVVGSGEGWLTELSTDALRELLVLAEGAEGD